MSDTSSETLAEPEPVPVPHWKIVYSQSLVNAAVLNHTYAGAGTEKNPYVVEFIPNDPRNPQGFSEMKKWTITCLVAIATLAVAFCSSAYSGGAAQLEEYFGASEELVTGGLSLFVAGYAVGPLFWAPLSELYGRQIIFFITYGVLTVFNAGTAVSQNIATVLVLRFIGGSFGSSPLTNAGGVIADMFGPDKRGLAMALFSAAPFMGPVLGPIVGGFVAETVGWRWVEGVMAIFTGILWIVGGACIPETYPPVLLHKRAARLSYLTGKVYKSKLDLGPKKRPTLGEAFKTALSRPWVLLFREPIVMILSIYIAIIYGTLYMLFAAFPIVYQQGRGWSEGIGGLSFLGVAVGMIIATVYSMFDNARYKRAGAEATARGSKTGAAPEARLPPAMVGCCFLPVGLLLFAWTNYDCVPWIISIIATVPFGFGMVLVFLSIINYLIDAYTLYAASVLAANSILRSLFGAAFPLFTSQMFANLGIHWASSVPGFLALMCVPFPFLLYKYGHVIRRKCKYSREAAEVLLKMKTMGGPGGPPGGGPPPGGAGPKKGGGGPPTPPPKKIIDDDEEDEKLPPGGPSGGMKEKSPPAPTPVRRRSSPSSKMPGGMPDDTASERDVEKGES